jgi:hypothetical protein
LSNNTAGRGRRGKHLKESTLKLDKFRKRTARKNIYSISRRPIKQRGGKWRDIAVVSTLD